MAHKAKFLAPRSLLTSEKAISLGLCYKKGEQRAEFPSLNFKPTGVYGIAPIQINLQFQGQQWKKRHRPSSLPMTPQGGLLVMASAIYKIEMYLLLVERPCFSFWWGKRSSLSVTRNYQSIWVPGSKFSHQLLTRVV